MDEMFFRISCIQKKMESNRNLQTIMKVVGFLTVFVIFFCSLSQPDTMKIAWILSIPVIVILFVIESFYIKQNKKYEFEIYKLEIENLERKKEIAEIIGEILPDYVLNRKVVMPNNEVSLPILNYAVLVLLDVLVKIFMIN